MMQILGRCLLLGVPLIVPAIAQGGAWKKIAWYAGTVVLAFLSLVALAVVYNGRHQRADIVVLISANVLMLSLAASGRQSSK